MFGAMTLLHIQLYNTLVLLSFVLVDTFEQTMLHVVEVPALPLGVRYVKAAAGSWHTVPTSKCVVETFAKGFVIVSPKAFPHRAPSFFQKRSDQKKASA